MSKSAKRAYIIHFICSDIGFIISYLLRYIPTIRLIVKNLITIIDVAQVVQKYFKSIFCEKNGR